jgi:hypothetical protein
VTVTPRTDDDGVRLRTMVTRIHASILSIICVVFIVVATVGWQSASGVYKVLATQPLGYLGLYQAYLLMLMMSVASVIGASIMPSRLWNVLLMCAHLVPLSALVVGYGPIRDTESTNLVPVSLVIHLALMALEAFTLLRKPSKAP